MGRRAVVAVTLACAFATLASPASGQQKPGIMGGGSGQSGGRSERHGSIPGGGCVSGVVTSGWWGWGPYAFGGGYYPAVIVGPPIYAGPSLIATPNGVVSSTPITWAGTTTPWMMAPDFDPAMIAAAPPLNAAMPADIANVPPPSRPGRRVAARVEELVKVGDRLFRAGELKRAEERYQQAQRADAKAPLPGLRLAQLAVKRGDYSTATMRLREVQAADPEWIDHVPARDVQNLFGEPADFAAELAKLESHVQALPDDRDAWLVLGAELFLTGRTDRAGDIFLRLTDRRPDALLQNFLDASRAVAPPRQQGQR